MTEAELEDGVPQTAGWFVLNARDGRWMHNDMRVVCRFSGEGEARFEDLGVGLYWLAPGKQMSMYHHEARQEDFLVLHGSCTLIIEGQERALEQWDFVHCPSGSAHTIVGAGDEPALLVAVGGRREPAAVSYPADPVALRHGAAAEISTDSPVEAYARFSQPERGPAPEILQ
jgi:uncharacterized cupin superfamily protein